MQSPTVRSRSSSTSSVRHICDIVTRIAARQLVGSSDSDRSEAAYLHRDEKIVALGHDDARKP